MKRIRVHFLVISFVFSITALSLSTPVVTSAVAKQNKIIRAINQLTVVKGNRNESERLNNLGLGMYKQNDFVKAEEYWFQAARADMSWWKPLFNLACTASLQGNIDDAFTYAQMALNRDPVNAMEPLQRDSDLKGLRAQTSRFNGLIAKYDQTCIPVLRKSAGNYSNKGWGLNIYSIDGKLQLGLYGPGEVGGNAYKIVGCSKSGQWHTIQTDESETVDIRIINGRTIEVKDAWIVDKTSGCHCNGIFKK